uniref:Protein wech n=1 Tax=Rhabditophanes sp. KR3021 TaxID=114890 RepID=A0AC35U4R2_9BILA
MKSIPLHLQILHLTIICLISESLALPINQDQLLVLPQDLVDELNNTATAINMVEQTFHEYTWTAINRTIGSADIFYPTKCPADCISEFNALHGKTPETLCSCQCSENSTAQWRNIGQTLFYLKQIHNVTKIIWNGNPMNAKALEGSIIKMKLLCQAALSKEFCLTIRTTGYQFSGHLDFNQSSFDYMRIAVVVCIVLLILFISYITISAILWNICWKRKETKLVSKLQLQFLQHIKQEKERTSLDLAKYRAALAAVQMGDLVGRGHRYTGYEDDGSGIKDMQKIYTKDTSVSGSNHNNMLLQQKRKLYFSPEFFEPHLMQNPPEMAEQFLFDLRKMIDVAKKRIKSQKHQPTLISIPEEIGEYEGEKMAEILTDLQINKISEECQSSNSPKSTKSQDSGRESMKDSGSSSDSAPPSPEIKKKEEAPKVQENKNVVSKEKKVAKVASKPVSKSTTNKNVANLIGTFEQKQVCGGSKVSKEEKTKYEANSSLQIEVEELVKPEQNNLNIKKSRSFSKIPKLSETNIGSPSPRLNQRKLVLGDPFDSNDFSSTLNNSPKKETKTNSPSKIPCFFSPTKTTSPYPIFPTGLEAMRKKSLPRKSKKPVVQIRDPNKLISKESSKELLETNM